jgi:cytochrome c553
VLAVLTIVLALVTLGLVVVAVVLRAGRRRQGGPTAAQRRVVTGTATGLCLVLGLGVPVLILADNSESKIKDGPGAIDLTSSEAHGRMLFKRNCATCHTLGTSLSAGRVGPNLDRLRPPAALVVNAITYGRARGRGQMPAGLLAGQDARDVAAYVSRVAGQGD